MKTNVVKSSRKFCNFADIKKQNIAMLEKINALKAEIDQLTASSAADVEALRIKYLSKKGAVSELMNEFRTLSPDEKRTLGAPLNELKITPLTVSILSARLLPTRRARLATLT